MKNCAVQNGSISPDALFKHYAYMCLYPLYPFEGWLWGEKKRGVSTKAWGNGKYVWLHDSFSTKLWEIVILSASQDQV